MPKGPQGQRRPADVVGNAVHIARIAIGDIEDTKRAPEKDYTSKAGIEGGKARAGKLSPKKRAEIALKAARSRWKGKSRFE